MHNYFGIGLRAKLAEMKMKQEALAADAGLNSKTIQRAINDQVDEPSKQLIAEALGTTIETLELIGRSRLVSRIWVAPESEKEMVHDGPTLIGLNGQGSAFMTGASQAEVSSYFMAIDLPPLPSPYPSSWLERTVCTDWRLIVAAFS